MTPPDDILLPPATRLVHIGPHKTGTTALQWAFHRQRDELEDLGVHYAGKGDQAYRPAVGLIGHGGWRGSPGVPESAWTDLVDEVAAAGDKRVMISSESFCNATAEHIARLRDDLGPDRLHVVRMVRRYDTLLPSYWQQTIAAGGVIPWHRLIERVLTEPDISFWRRHGFVTLTKRWADVVGPGRMTVVVVDESDHAWLLRVAERLLGLPESTLRPDEGSRNRSLSLAETRTLRYLNLTMRDRAWDSRAHLEYVRRGISRGLRKLAPDPLSGRTVLPDSARAALAERTAHDVAQLQELGVRIVGDLGWLEPAAPVGDTPPGPQPRLQPESVVVGVRAVVDRVERVEPFRLVEPDRYDDLAPPRPVAGDAATAAAAGEQDSDGPADLVIPIGATGRAFRAVGAPGRGLRRPTATVLVASPLHELLLAWQQHLAAGGTEPLESVLAAHPTPELPGRLSRRSCVIVVPMHDAAAVRRLRSALGQPEPSDHPVPPLSYPELDLLRRLNEELGASARGRFLADAIDWISSARRAAPILPASVRDEVELRTAALRGDITARKVTMIDDAGLLGRIPPGCDDGAPVPVPPEVAGMVLAAVIARTDPTFSR